MLANAIGIRGEKGKGKKTNHISTCSHKRGLNTVEGYALVFFDTMQVIRLCSVLLSWIIKRKLVGQEDFLNAMLCGRTFSIKYSGKRAMRGP